MVIILVALLSLLCFLLASCAMLSAFITQLDEEDAYARILTATQPLQKTATGDATRVLPPQM